MVLVKYWNYDIPVLGSLVRNNEDIAITTISDWLIELALFFSVDGKTMTENQVLSTAQIICDDERFRYLSAADFQLFGNMAKKGEFGKSYGTLTGVVILGWLSQYFNIRCEAFAETRDRDNGQQRASDDEYKNWMEWIKSSKERAETEEAEKQARQAVVDKHNSEFNINKL